jgi:hypothetical protein
MAQIEIPATQDQEVLIYCGKPNCPGSTGLRCIRTDVPICMKCAVLVKGVGYISKDAARAHEKRFYNIQNTDYLIVGIIGFMGLLLIGFPYLLFLGNFWFISFFLSPIIGTLIGQTAWRAIGNRRGKYTARVITGSMAAAGVLLVLIFFIIGSFAFVSAILFSILATGTAAASFRVSLRS